MLSIPAALPGEKKEMYWAMFLAGSFPGGITAFKFSELARSTNNFSSNNIIGSGGFGNVYKVSYMLLFCSYNYEKDFFSIFMLKMLKWSWLNQDLA